MTNDNQEMVKKYTGAIARGLIGQVPMVGSVAVELLNVTIPNQRQERIEKLLNILASRVFDIPEEELKQKFQTTDFIDIFEDVLLQTVRATSQERLEYLASVLEKGLNNEEFDHLQVKRLLEILAKINDIEVILLQYYSLSDMTDLRRDNEEKNIFKQKHQNIFENWKSENFESKKVRNPQKRAIMDHYKDNLITLGLIGPSYLGSSVGRRNILFPTHLGYMLLDLIGISVNNQTIGIPINPYDVSMQLSGEREITENTIKRNREEAIKQINTEGKKAVDEIVRKIQNAHRFR